ncbi:hypothetical protein CKA34_14230 [Rhizobium sp. 11515TR]|nr:hypothetical protein CKA34_14230 [Rhizobium sp. 11515TR]
MAFDEVIMWRLIAGIWCWIRVGPACRIFHFGRVLIEEARRVLRTEAAFVRSVGRSSKVAEARISALCFRTCEVSKPKKGMIDHLSPQELI